jgi:hypothetical protein
MRDSNTIPYWFSPSTKMVYSRITSSVALDGVHDIEPYFFRLSNPASQIISRISSKIQNPEENPPADIRPMTVEDITDIEDPYIKDIFVKIVI